MPHKLARSQTNVHAHQLVGPVASKSEVMPKLAFKGVPKGQTAATHPPVWAHSMASVAAAHIYNMT